MNIKKHIPNFLTCCNLLCGSLGVIKCFEFSFSENPYGNLTVAAFLIFLAGIFDFFDGFVARLLKVSSPIGKELDSLADVISFGLLPGIILFRLIHDQTYDFLEPGWIDGDKVYLISLIALLIPVFSALRLAKFNIDNRQSESFIGVPTPTNAILVASFPLILSGDDFEFIQNIIGHPYFLIGYSIVMSYLLVAELQLFALKFKSFSWQDNKMKYILIISSVILLALLKWAAIPLIILLYILLSVVDNRLLSHIKSK